MTALTTTEQAPLAKTASEECSPALWRLLTHTNVTFSAAVEEIVRLATPEDLREITPRLDRHSAGCGDKAVIAALAPLVTLYGLADRSEGEWTAFWRFYIDALSDAPPEALREGVAAYVANAKSEFFPKPGPLKALVDEKARAVRTATYRARAAIEQLNRRQAAA